MTITKPAYHVYYILIDKNCFSCLYLYRIIKCLYFYYPIHYIDELQILMPVHNLKARISRIGCVVHNIKNQIGKIRVYIQIDRIDDKMLNASVFLTFVNQVWPGDYDIERTKNALSKTLNITAYDGKRLVGCLRILTDGYQKSLQSYMIEKTK